MLPVWRVRNAVARGREEEAEEEEEGAAEETQPGGAQGRRRENVQMIRNFDDE